MWRIICALQSWSRGHAYEWQNWPYWLLLQVPNSSALVKITWLNHDYIEKNDFENKPTPVLSASPSSLRDTFFSQVLFPPISLALSYQDKNIPPLSLTSYLLCWTYRVIFSLVIFVSDMFVVVSKAKPAQLMQGDLGSVPLWASIKLPSLLWFQNLYCR